ncbi:hypothetical protein TL16_g01862 [Triparma laevis f. inornata]|uniref:Uncharacterized protein n=1 Tax=Triparma laevis f. inornata TaxID=1714386 RepID=A0A9W6ZRM3_9STRA|nr:hypothetical protein TL16_g01862 [Triparma laevis f. inornata]
MHSKTATRVLILDSDIDDSYSSSSDSETGPAVVLSQRQLRKLLSNTRSKGEQKASKSGNKKDERVEESTAEDENIEVNTEEGAIRGHRPYSRGNLNNFPFKDDEPLTSLVATSTLPSPFWNLPPRYQIHLAKKTFKDYSLNNPKSRGRQGKLLMDVKDLLPSMEELFGEGWMKFCPGGLRWWVVGVGNGDVEGFLDGRKFEGGMREGEFVEIVAVTSEGILTKQSKKGMDGDGEVFLEGGSVDDDDDTENSDDDLIVVKSRHHKHHHHHRKKHQHRHKKSRLSNHHKRHGKKHQKQPEVDSSSSDALESFVTKELVRRSQSPLRHYIRQAQESASIKEGEEQLYIPRPPRHNNNNNKAREKPVAWSIPVEGEAEGLREGGGSQDKEAEEEAENFINDVLEEDKPAGGEGGVAENVPMSKVPGQPTTAQLKALRHTLESADATSHHNSSITGTCHARVFIRTCQAILQWTPGEEEVRMLSSKGGEVCYRVFLRDPVGWGYNVRMSGGAGVGVGSTAAMIADKARGGVKIVAKDDGQGIVRNLRMKLVKIAGEGQFGVKGLPALKRAFEIFDEAGSECVDTETFFRVVTRLGVRVGSKGRKKLTHILGVEGGKKMSYAKLLDFSTSSEEAEAELEFKIVAAVIAAMRRCKCTYEALRGAVLAWDESSCGSVTLEDFAKALQQSGVGNELSKGLIEAIGRRYAGERSMVVYGGFLSKIKEACDELEEKERRLKVADSMRRRDDEREAEAGGVSSMREMADHAARRLKERGAARDQNFGDPFFAKGKTSGSKRTKKPTKPAWRANKGHAPSTIPKPEVKMSSRVLPKYLRNVESRIKGDLESVRDRRVRAKASRIDAAKEVVARRRLDKHMADGLDGGDDLGAKLGEELLAREIADMYVGVVDDVLEGQGGQALGEVFGDVDEDSDEDSDEDGARAGTYIVKAREEGGKGELSGWIGDFDFSKGGKGKGKEVKGGEEFKGESGKDLTGEIMELKEKEKEVEGGGDGGDAEK